MKKSIITVLVKHPGHPAFFVSTLNTLEALQGLVDGYIETVTMTDLAENLVLICNEEGYLQGLPVNCELCGMHLVGSIVLAGSSGDEFDDVPMSRAQAQKLFPALWEV